MVKCRRFFYEFENHCSKAPARALRKQRETTYITSISSDQGQKIFKSLEIAKRFREFYTTLYNLKLTYINQEEDKRLNQICEYIKDLNLPILKEEVVKVLESLIYMDELETVVKQFSLLKPLGPDGFPA